MKIFITSFIFITLCIQNVFAEDSSVIIDCPKGNQIKCENNQGTGTFSIVLKNKTISHEAEVKPKIFSTEGKGPVSYSVHSSTSESNTLTCAIQRNEGGKSQFIDFPISIEEINTALK